MNYKFVLIDTANETELRAWILPPPVTVGRCPTADITINDASISRRHCQFLFNPHDALIVRDLGSKNGVYVDERRVDKTLVSPGAMIRIGRITLRLELTEEELDDSNDATGILDLDAAETQPMRIVQLNDRAE